jgi:hypothetical protein
MDQSEGHRPADGGEHGGHPESVDEPQGHTQTHDGAHPAAHAGRSPAHDEHARQSSGVRYCCPLRDRMGTDDPAVVPLHRARTGRRSSYRSEACGIGWEAIRGCFYGIIPLAPSIMDPITV